MWIAYYRREWLASLRSALVLTRRVFRLSWPSAIRGSWFALRAFKLWAPFPDNDPAAAQRAMEGFYRVLKEHSNEPLDPAEAARLEVAWWQVHREQQHKAAEPDGQALIDAMADLYAYTYDVPPAAVRVAAEHRALAMRYSDQWVREGCHRESPLIEANCAALVRAYTGLLEAVQQQDGAGVRQGEHSAQHRLACGPAQAAMTATRSASDAGDPLPLARRAVRRFPAAILGGVLMSAAVTLLGRRLPGRAGRKPR